MAELSNESFPEYPRTHTHASPCQNTVQLDTAFAQREHKTAELYDGSIEVRYTPCKWWIITFWELELPRLKVVLFPVIAANYVTVTTAVPPEPQPNKLIHRKTHNFFHLRFSSTERQLVCRLLVYSQLLHPLHHPVFEQSRSPSITIQEPSAVTPKPIEAGSRGSTARTNNRKNHRHRKKAHTKTHGSFFHPSPLRGEIWKHHTQCRELKTGATTNGRGDVLPRLKFHYNWRR